MKTRITLLLVLLLATAVAGCRSIQPTATSPEARWWKGNLHTHSLWSDGDDFPEMIMAWYKDHGYDFVALSDHNTLAEGERWLDVPEGAPHAVAYERYLARFGADWIDRRRVRDTLRVRLKTFAEYRPRFEEAGRFLIIQSEEISDRYETKPIHVNATNVAERIEPQGGTSVRDVMQRNVDAVLEQRRRTGRPMFPHINHPNFGWAVTAEDLIGLEGEKFFEVYNGHPLVHNEGDATRPGTERLWDIVLAERLSRGAGVLYGLATDDAHSYHDFASNRSNPGRGWVVVRAAQLTPEALIAAMERGDFYATTGVVLDDVRSDGETIALRIRPEPGVTYRTQFIGTRAGYTPHTETVERVEGSDRTHTVRRYSDEIGVVLAEVEGTNPTYTPAGDELYVRAKIISSKAKANPYREGEVEAAWTQPVTMKNEE